MKKILVVTFLLLFCCGFACAAQWQEINARTYIDTGSVIKFKKSTAAWFKTFPEDNKQILERQVGYTISFDKYYCDAQPRYFITKQKTVYDVKGNIITSSEKHNVKTLIEPDTNADNVAQFICGK